MNLDTFWTELRRRRVVRVVVAYAVAVFIILQVASLTFEPLGLPAWTYQFVLILCMGGFPVVSALAWAFDVKKDSGSDAETKKARSFRVTRPVIIGCIVLLGSGFALWNFSTNPTEIEADGVDVDLMAVVPFRISSADERVTILREGVLDMLAPIFSGKPEIIDSGRMINAWRDYAGDSEANLSEAESVELARRLGAGRVLVGSVVGDGEGFAMNARLLRVPGGDLIGDVSIDGSAPSLRETLTQLASQVLSMEAGVDEGQIDYLTELPLDALAAYLDGRSAYRRTAYVEARTAYIRALDIDSTFALAALGAYQAIQMGLDTERFSLQARVGRLLRNHLDNLPPRDEEFVRLLLPTGRSSVVERHATLGELVNRFPERPEAWYQYGDQMFHNMWRVSQDDWSERSKEAFEKALDLDPLMEITRQHLDYHQAMSPDTVGLRDMLNNRIRIAAGSETEVWARSSMASMLGDSANLAWINDNIEQLSYTQVQMLIINEGMIPFGFRYPSPYMDRIFARTERSALTPTDRMQHMTLLHGYLRSAGRSDEADDVLRDFEAEFYPVPNYWIEANLYWDGPADPARNAVPVLQASIPAQGSLTGPDATSATILEVWKMRQGDLSSVGLTIERLRDGSNDPDPAHGRNAYFALALETVAAHRRNEARSTELVEELTRTLDQGVAGAPYWSQFELSSILEERGNPAKAARILKYVGGTDPFPLGMSTILREAGRLNELAGNLTEALNDYRSFQRIRPNPDSRFDAMSESIGQRIAELEATLEN